MSSQRERIVAFLQLAKEELDVASWIVERAPRQCAYLVQQAAEKLARAILTDADVKFGTGHNLGQMAEACRKGIHGSKRSNLWAGTHRLPPDTAIRPWLVVSLIRRPPRRSNGMSQSLLTCLRKLAGSSMKRADANEDEFLHRHRTARYIGVTSFAADR